MTSSATRKIRKLTKICTVNQNSIDINTESGQRIAGFLYFVVYYNCARTQCCLIKDFHQLLAMQEAVPYISWQIVQVGPVLRETSRVQTEEQKYCTTSDKEDLA